MNNIKKALKNEIETKYNQLKSDPHYQQLSLEDESTKVFNNSIESLLLELNDKTGELTNDEVFGLQVTIAILDNCLSVQFMSDNDLIKSPDTRMEEIYNESLKFLDIMRFDYEKARTTKIEDIQDEYRTTLVQYIQQMKVHLDTIEAYMESLDSFKVHFKNDINLALVNLNILKKFTLKERKENEKQ